MFKIVWITNKGLKREKNEDALLINNLIIQNDNMQSPSTKEISDDEELLLAVADGLGGHKGGEIASKLTLEILSQYRPQDENEIIKTLRQAHHRLLNYVVSNPQCFGFGTCIAGALITRNQTTFFNVGDCRVYKFHNNTINQITKDHSLVQEYVDKGLITKEQTYTHPQRNVVTESIGGIMDYRFIDVRTYKEPLLPDDILLICSDGLFDMLQDKEIELSISADLEKSILQLFNLTMQKGAKDNLSIILCKYIN